MLGKLSPSRPSPPLRRPLHSFENIKLSDDVLNKFSLIKKIHPEAILAGGALRDSVFGKPIKDIDIFIEFPFSNFAELLNMKIERSAASIDYTLFDTDTHIKGIYDVFTRDDTPPIQIIELESLDIQALLSGFDWGFCQIGTKDCKSFIVTDHFMNDYNNNTATCVLESSDTRLKHSLKRGKKLFKKYPDKKFMTPLSSELFNILTMENSIGENYILA